MGKSRVLYHPDVMWGSTAIYVIKKVLLTGFVLGLVACAFLIGHQVSQEQQRHESDEAKDEGPLVRLKRALARTLTEEPVATGAVFTRWGRTVCPDDASLVYKGVMGGQHSTYEGYGNKHLCLSDKPEWGKDGTSGGAYIAGVEYKSGEELFDKDNAEKLINHDAVCAVCRSARSVQVMIPGQQSCMEGWTQEYYGYLMTSYSSVAAKDYVCIDHAPEADKAGYEDKGGALLGPVAAICGSLPCPGYIEGKRLTCVLSKSYRTLHMLRLRSFSYVD